ncbi:Transposon Tf2-9 poly, partial [Paramuricea clavata]
SFRDDVLYSENSYSGRKIRKFVVGTDFEAYAEQLEFFFVANSVTDAKQKKAVLLTNMPAETYQLTKDLFAPHLLKEDTITYEAIVERLQKQLKPQKSALVARYEFDNRARNAGETVSEYVAVLKHLATECKFNETMRLERLRDRLVSGIRDRKMMSELLKLKLEELTFDTAVAKCIAIEQSCKDVETMQGGRDSNHTNKESDSVNLLNKPEGQNRNAKAKKGRDASPSPADPKCYRCHGDHQHKSCPFKNAICHHCKKSGHIRRACRKRSKETHSFKPPVNHIDDDDDKLGKVPYALRPKDIFANLAGVSAVLQGLVNYYNRFLPNAASVLHPLHVLLQKSHKWKWTEQCEKAFKNAKHLITSDLVLTHYDTTLPVKIACDASPTGIGAVSLTKTERKYSQIDKEALSIVWGVKKFHIYLYGRRFTLVTDHKPLTSIFHPEKGIPIMTATRFQRYALFLAGFEYDIEYKNTKEHCNADGLSRLPLPMTEKEDTAVDAAEVFHATQLNILPVTSESVAKETNRDPILARVYDSIVKASCKREFCESYMIVIWNQKMPSKVSLHPWEWTTSPWQRVHIDYAGPFKDTMFLVVVDAHSKWPEVIPMKSTTAAKTIEVLRNLFARFGIPEQIVSDNGPQFVSEEFRSFMKSNGVKHITSAPYHPATNGLAERSVQTFKQALRSMEESSKPIQEKLAKFLITYRNTPHSTTGESPAQLMLGRPIRTRLDLVKPNLNRKMVIKQQEQSRKSASAKNRATRQLEVGDMVMARDYRGNLKWRSGKVIERIGPLMYKIEVTSGVIWRRHIDQLLPTEDSRLNAPVERLAVAEILRKHSTGGVTLQTETLPFRRKHSESIATAFDDRR